MNRTEAAAILRQHNAWRRDDSDTPPPMQSPKLLGEAIDVAIAELDATPIGWGEIENGRLVSFAHQRSEQCTTEIFAPGAAARTGGAA